MPNPIREDLGYRAQPQTWLSRTGLSLLGKIFCWNLGNPNGGANPIGEDFLLQSGKPWVVLILSRGGFLTGGSGYTEELCSSETPRAEGLANIL